MHAGERSVCGFVFETSCSTAPQETACSFQLQTVSFFPDCRLFRQPMVPVVGADEGRWPLAGALAPMMKPGGHGAIWKLMLDEGVFAWLAAHRREAALVRQIRCLARKAGSVCTN